MWCHVQSYFDRKRETAALLRQLRRTNLADAHLPEEQHLVTHTVFVGELPWAPSCNLWRLAQEPVIIGDTNYRVYPTTAQYRWENGTFDCSVDNTIEAFVPSTVLAEDGGLQWTKHGFSFGDVSGNVVAYDPSSKEPGP